MEKKCVQKIIKYERNKSKGTQTNVDITILLEGKKNQYCENGLMTKSYLHFQWNFSQITNDIFQSRLKKYNLYGSIKSLNCHEILERKKKKKQIQRNHIFWLHSIK